jgi:hypothetical protein
MPGNEWTLRARRDGAVLAVVASGVATLDSLRTLRAFIAGAVKVHRALAVVADLSSAVPKMSGNDWQQCAKEAAEAGLNVPVALVVAEAYFPASADFCLAAARQGLRRMAFTDLDRASLWARDEVAELSALVAPAPDRLASSSKARLMLVSQRQ